MTDSRTYMAIVRDVMQRKAKDLPDNEWSVLRRAWQEIEDTFEVENPPQVAEGMQGNPERIWDTAYANAMVYLYFRGAADGIPDVVSARAREAADFAVKHWAEGKHA